MKKVLLLILLLFSFPVYAITVLVVGFQFIPEDKLFETCLPIITLFFPIFLFLQVLISEIRGRCMYIGFMLESDVKRKDNLLKFYSCQIAACFAVYALIRFALRINEFVDGFGI